MSKRQSVKVSKKVSDVVQCPDNLQRLEARIVELARQKTPVRKGSRQMSTGSPPHAVKLSAVSADVPPKRYRIGELAQYTGLSRQTLHNYTRWGLISELAWTAGGHRVYGEESFARLRRIIELKRTCTMDEIRDQLQEIV